MRSPEQIKQLVVAGFGGIKRDLDSLGTLHVARDDRGHARRLFKNRFGATKNNRLRNKPRLDDCRMLVGKVLS